MERFENILKEENTFIGTAAALFNNLHDYHPSVRVVIINNVIFFFIKQRAQNPVHSLSIMEHQDVSSLERWRSTVQRLLERYLRIVLLAILASLATLADVSVYKNKQKTTKHNLQN